LPRYLLGIDAGQTAVKAVVHDEQLAPIGVGRRSSPVDRPSPGFAERAQDSLWAATAAAIRESIGEAGIDAADIAAIAVSGHGDGLHLVDANGAAVGTAITAMDSRAHREADELLSDGSRRDAILRISGQLPGAGAAAPLLLWMRAHEPAVLDRAAAMLSCKDVVRSRLTGEISTDLSDATASFLDTSVARWSPELLAICGLGELERLLPPLHVSGDIVGNVLPAAAEQTGLAVGTPVVAGLHDVPAASIGMGALIPGRLALVAGSFSTNGVTTRDPAVDPRWQSRLSVSPSLRIAMSTSPTSAPALEWVLRLLGVDGSAARDSLFAEAAALDPTVRVPLVLPYMTSSPVDPTATAAITGVEDWHGRAHVLRGALEGIALMHFWHSRALSDAFTWDEPVLLGGGLSRAPLYTRLVADVMRSPIEVVANDEAGAFGAAAVAGTAVGVFESLDAAQRLVPRSRIVEPDPATAGYWADVIGTFDALNTALTPVWHRTADSR
jgi:L-xylulokinase